MQLGVYCDRDKKASDTSCICGIKGNLGNGPSTLLLHDIETRVHLSEMNDVLVESYILEISVCIIIFVQ